MEEFYKIRYNLYKYFMNIDKDTYTRYVNLYATIIFIVGIILPLFLISIIKDINIYILIFIGFIILYYYVSYKLYNYLINISNNKELKSYKLLYEILNIIYRENKETINNYKKFKLENDILKSNIRNIENIYNDEIINNLILKAENNNDILKYYDFTSYLNNDDNFNLIYNKNNNKTFISKSGGISDYYINYNYNYDDDNTDVSKNLIQIKLNILFDNSRLNDSNINEIQNNLLIYINKKYNKNLSTLYIKPDIDDDKFLFKDLIKTLKSNILLYTIIVLYFILILLHGLFIYFNITLIYIYLLLIIISLIIMFYYN